jgi:hypothetical protein
VTIAAMSARVPAGADTGGVAVADEAINPARVLARAVLLWPGLDRRQLGRTGGDPQRVVRLVARRSSLPPESIREMLTRE